MTCLNLWLVEQQTCNFVKESYNVLKTKLSTVNISLFRCCIKNKIQRGNGKRLFKNVSVNKTWHKNRKKSTYFIYILICQLHVRHGGHKGSARQILAI